MSKPVKFNPDQVRRALSRQVKKALHAVNQMRQFHDLRSSPRYDELKKALVQLAMLTALMRDDGTIEIHRKEKPKT